MPCGAGSTSSTLLVRAPCNLMLKFSVCRSGMTVKLMVYQHHPRPPLIAVGITYRTVVNKFIRFVAAWCWGGENVRTSPSGCWCRGESQQAIPIRPIITYLSAMPRECFGKQGGGFYPVFDTLCMNLRAEPDDVSEPTLMSRLVILVIGWVSRHATLDMGKHSNKNWNYLSN